MSHLKQRKETNCLNCGTEVQGRYCHQCGQENVEPKESVLHLVRHFFEDITHFDGKFFSTIGLLIRKPGFLSKEYMLGRRASYLNPVRLYVFTSAFFFLLFFGVFRTEEGVHFQAVSDVNGKKPQEIARMDSATFADFTRTINRNNDKGDIPMTRAQFQAYLDTFTNHGNVIRVGDIGYTSHEEYDSLLRVGARHDNWFTRKLINKMIDINIKYKNNVQGFLQAFKEHVLHSFPQMLFISLPLLAFLLKLLYVRRKQYYYVNHAIFGIHVYVFVFINILVTLIISAIANALGWGWMSYLNLALILGMFVYAAFAMRRFYGQNWFKTLVKYLLLLLGLIVILLILLNIFAFFSFINL